MSPAGRHAGFTLLELIVALVLLGLLSAVLFGSLRLAGQSTDRGDAAAQRAASMRLAQQFLRANLEAQHPLRMRKIVDWPLLFTGTQDELRYAANLPPRIAGGGIWFYRLAVIADDARSPLVLERTIPDLTADQLPEFTKAERSVLAYDIASLKIAYFGRDPDAGPASEPSWRDKWADAQKLPLVIRIDVQPKGAPAWPTLYVSPRESPEAGCRAWDMARERCAAV
ncbi:MAG TPA: prepilin-type N-terminal cleavage/methylation domain-containing protein [Casimicrobiaceae bacterium]|jgi:general secretion pathway protein J|nr:prepilin-type N-terminal cleavage/methylation domain-containing protein [Casimicrobiaceae bacterium]HWD35366.1 prepilin-type N-terminal cleavage/methylation domain-containing protein [Casimicrobiaceae bacterium]